MGGVLRNQQENTCNFDRLQSGEGLSLKVLEESRRNLQKIALTSEGVLLSRRKNRSGVYPPPPGRYRPRGLYIDYVLKAKTSWTDFRAMTSWTPGCSS
jgi:hypothetical protein